MKSFNKTSVKLLLSLLFFLFSLILINSENQKKQIRVLGSQTLLKTDQNIIAAWEQILEERPDYRDGWIQLAATYYKINQIEKARQALSKAKALDPTNEVILNFEKLLEN